MEAKNNLKNLIQIFCTFEAKDLDKVVDSFKVRLVKKNEIILAGGAVAREFYFINRGCIGTYFITKKGHEKTRYLIMEPSIGTALASFISQKPSLEFIDAIEKTELLAISHKDFNHLLDEIPQWKNFYIKILEMAYSFQNKKINSLVTLSAKERYDQLLQQNPKVVQCISNKILASYLDIKQETLSRLKSK